MARILLVDDDQPIRGFLRLLLEGADHEVLEAGDGAEAICICEKEYVELVFCDLFMPGKDGLETIRELRRNHPGVKIVAMSGGGLSGVMDMLSFARPFGAGAVLRKPFDREMVLATVESVLPQAVAAAV
jgi:CheY-like chemotaxis protein